MDDQIKAGKFKAECLKIMETVRKTRRKVIITKRNVPFVKLVPIDEEETIAFGKLKGTVKFFGDILSPIDMVWNADS